MIYDTILQLIGNTPMVQLQTAEDVVADVVAKIEYFNPGGSVKDRAAYHMIAQAEAKGQLYPGATIIEPTSGNTGVALAMIAAVKGYHVIMTMPESMSIERRMLLQAYGAQIVLTPAALGMNGAIEKAKELLAQIEGSFMCGQFDNEDNAQAHYLTTAQEIYAQSNGKVDILISAIGTGGTITGIARGLKEYRNEIAVIGVEPKESAVLHGQPAAPHKIQGIGAGFVPAILDRSIIDEVMMVSSKQAMECSRNLAQQQGILVGISSGAALAAAYEVGKRLENKGKMIVVILPDTGERYLSTSLFLDEEKQ